MQRPQKERRCQEENTKDVSHAAQGIKRRWARHLVRLDYNHWVKVTTIWEKWRGSRKLGRPATRWMDIKKEAGKTMNQNSIKNVKNGSTRTSAEAKLR